MSKKSIRFFNDREVRAVWDDEHNKWWFSATDIVRAINDEEDYTKCRNYWKYLKGKMAKEGVQLVSVTNQFKFLSPDGKELLVGGAGGFHEGLLRHIATVGHLACEPPDNSEHIERTTQKKAHLSRTSLLSLPCLSHISTVALGDTPKYLFAYKKNKSQRLCPSRLAGILFYCLASV